ncbi:MAG: hypothetical protein PHR68_02165 [Candidatus Gracilibacteria bacterium]|nr:hypothetical protein [Candidatus Gracilibacteria bacterium]
MTNIDKQTQIENLKKDELSIKEDILNELLNKIKETKNIQDRENLLDKATDMIIDLSGLDELYSKSKEDIKNDTKKIIKLSISNKLDSNLQKFNLSKFDIDYKLGLDKTEVKNYSSVIKIAVQDMIKLGGLNSLSQVYGKVSQKDGWKNLDKKIADKANLQELIFGEKGSKHFCESAIQKLGEIDEEKLKQMQERDFKITSGESWEELSILLAKEFGDGIEDVLRFIGNIPSGVILVPRYTMLRFDVNSDNDITKTQSEIELRELVEQNPSLGLLELLGEKGLEILKQLGEMLTSGKQGDIALTLVTIAGLIAGGTGAVKLGLNIARKTSVKGARIAGKESRLAGETTSKIVRNNLKTISGNIGKIAKTASRIDDIVGGAGIGHLTGQFSGVEIKKDGKRVSTGVASKEILKVNGKLNDIERIEEASNLLGRELSKIEQDGLLVAHNYPQGDNIAKGKALMTAGFSRDEALILMDKGIAGISNKTVNDYEHIRNIIGGNLIEKNKDILSHQDFDRYKTKGEDIIKLHGNFPITDKSWPNNLFFIAQYWKPEIVGYFDDLIGLDKLSYADLYKHSNHFENLELSDVKNIVNNINDVFGGFNRENIINYFNLFRYNPQIIDFLKPELIAKPGLLKSHHFFNNEKVSTLNYIDLFEKKLDNLLGIGVNITAENFFKYYDYTPYTYRLEKYILEFGSDFNEFINKTGVVFDNEILSKLYEKSKNFENRYGNGYAAFTRNISYLINNNRINEIFGIEIDKIDVNKIKEFKSDNIYIDSIRTQILSLFEKNEVNNNYEYFSSGLGMRDKSCKDVESYFTELIETSNANNNFRIIGDFIEKNIDKPYDKRTAIAINDINVNGVFYPRGYLFRLNTNGDLIKGVEPLRVTMFSGGKDMWREGGKTFSYQFEEYYDGHVNILSQYKSKGEDLIDIFIRKING